MGACLSKKKETSISTHPKSLSTPLPHQQNSNNTLFTETTLNTKINTLQEKQQHPDEFHPQIQQKQQTPDEFQPKKEIFIIKHRKSHDERDKNNIKITPLTVQHNVQSQTNDGSLVFSSETESSISNNNVVVGGGGGGGGGVGVRTSSCTKEEVDAILIQCGRLSRSSSGKAASSSTRKYSDSKRSFDFDNNNDSISPQDEQKIVNASDNSEEQNRNHRQRHRNSPSPKPNRRRRTPSREREQRSSSRERRVSRSPGRRSSENGSNNNNNNGSGSGSGCYRPGKMVTVPATVTSLVMDKSNNGGECVKRVNVKRNVASPRSMSPARGSGNVVNQQQGSLSRSNSARKTEAPYRRNPLSEVDPNSLAYPQSNANNGGSKVQNKGKKEIEAEAVQKPNVDTRDNIRNKTSSRGALEKGVNYHTKEQQEEEIKVMSSISDNAIVKNVIPSGITRSRSSRRSRDFDNIINPETLITNPPQSSYTSLLLKDIHNFHQNTTTTQQESPVSLPPCLNKACSILEAVADLNSTTKTSNFSRLDDNCNKKFINEYNVACESFVESEVDVMEPSFHKYVTVKRGGSICEDQESSGSNSFTVSSGQQQWNICSSGDSSECWSSRLSSKDDSLKRRECDHQHSGGIGRGRLVNTATAAST